MASQVRLTVLPAHLQKLVSAWRTCGKYLVGILQGVFGPTNNKGQAVLDGVPPTGLRLLRPERVLLMLRIQGLENMEN